MWKLAVVAGDESYVPVFVHTLVFLLLGVAPLTGILLFNCPVLLIKTEVSVSRLQVSLSHSLMPPRSF